MHKSFKLNLIFILILTPKSKALQFKACVKTRNALYQYIFLVTGRRVSLSKKVKK